MVISLLFLSEILQYRGEQKAAAGEGEGLKNGEGEGKACNAGCTHPISVVLRGKH